jgi:hypothetical protein
MNKNPVTNRDRAEFAEGGLRVLTEKEAAQVSGGLPRPILVNKNPNPDSNIRDEYNQRLLEGGDGLAN